jgi:hypothetical protein
LARTASADTIAPKAKVFEDFFAFLDAPRQPIEIFNRADRNVLLGFSTKTLQDKNLAAATPVWQYSRRRPEKGV